MRQLLTLTTCTLVTGIALAADAPARKSGLWELTTSMGGPQAMQTTMQACVDAKTDQWAGPSADMQKNCSKNAVSHSAGMVTVDSVCSFNGTTASTHAEFRGNFGSTYRGDIHTTYTPPMHGLKDSRVSIAARWLGPCKPGMKPGDMLMPGGMKFNRADLPQPPQ